MNKILKEGICPPGGDTTIDAKDYHLRADENLHQWGSGSLTKYARKGLCVQPVNCPFVSDCLQRVVYIPADFNHMKRDIVIQVYFRNHKPIIQMNREDGIY